MIATFHPRLHAETSEPRSGERKPYVRYIILLLRAGFQADLFLE